MLNPTPQTTYLKDYRPPAYLISNVLLDIDIQHDATVVRADAAGATQWRRRRARRWC